MCNSISSPIFAGRLLPDRCSRRTKTLRTTLYYPYEELLHINLNLCVDIAPLLWETTTTLTYCMVYRTTTRVLLRMHKRHNKV